MKSNRIALFLVVLTLGFGFASEFARGHEIFQDILKEKYTLKSFSCKTCHQDSDNRKLRTPFAELYAEALKDGNWSAKWAEVEPKGEEAIAAFETEIGEAFKKSLDNVGKKTLTVDDLFAAGLLAGVRVDEKKRKAMEAEGKKSNGAALNMGNQNGVSSPATGPSALTMSVRASFAPTPRIPQPDSFETSQSRALVSKTDD
jgi:hypothetical protein